MICPHCQKEFNAGKVMGSAKSPKKSAAARKRGEIMRVAFANARKLNQARPTLETVVEEIVNENISDIARMQEPVIPPKPTTLEGKKAAALAALGGWRPVKPEAGYHEAAGLEVVPHAPFDVNIEGEPHRVAQMGKGGLWLFYLSQDGNKPIRKLEYGEMEKLWERRIQ